MIAHPLPFFPLLRRTLWVAALVGVVAVVICGWLSRAAWLPAYRFAAFGCLAPLLGSVLFTLIYRLTGGHWGESIEPFLAAGCRLAPWAWLVAWPVLLTTNDAAAWPGYGSHGMLAVRGAGYAVLLFALAVPLGRTDRAPPGWLGPAGFIALVFALHLLAEDGLGALEPDWHSTAFPLVWMTGLAVSGLAGAVLVAIAGGKLPAQKPPHGERAVGLDWGNLLLAALVFWCYVAFAQFLIIWAGNLPSETSWFLHRSRGPWAAVPPALAVFHFVLPFAILLSRRAKRSRFLLAVVALVLLGAQLVYLAWVILPVAPGHGAAGAVLPFALLAVGGAFFLHLYLNAAARRLEGR